jgi:ketosteroid isomerase-like protein
MSRENVEVVRRAFEAALRKPKPDFATVNALYDPNHELVTPIRRLEGVTLRGAEGFRTWLRDVGEHWESWEMRLDPPTEIDHDRVLVRWWFVGRGKRGGVPVEQLNAFVVTVRDGKVARTETYSSPREALEAVGLRE